jgi:hypothetical protein
MANHLFNINWFLISSRSKLSVAGWEPAHGLSRMKRFLFLSVFVMASVSASAQCRYGGTLMPIMQDRPFKIKAVVGVSSSTARVADYVEFRTMENIYSATDPPKLLFGKDTPIYGVVTRRKHRHFPSVGGQLELELEPLINWDGTRVEIAIARHGPINQKKANEESKKERKSRNKPCKQDRDNCIAGRRNLSVAPVVPAVAATGAGAVAAIAKEEETRFIAATAFFSIAKELGDLLNGTDAEISKDEIFDMFISPESQRICIFPKEE